MRMIVLALAVGALGGCAGTKGVKQPAPLSAGGVPVKSAMPPLSARKQHHDQLNDALAYKGMTTVEGDVSR